MRHDATGKLIFCVLCVMALYNVGWYEWAYAEIVNAVPESSISTERETKQSGTITRTCPTCPDYSDEYDMRYWWEVSYQYLIFMGSDCFILRFYLEGSNTYGFSLINHGGASNFDAAMQLMNSSCQEVESTALGEMSYEVPYQASGYYYLKIFPVGDVSGEFWLAYTILQDHCWACPSYDYDLGTITSSYQLSPGFIEYTGYDPGIPNPPKPCRVWRGYLNAWEQYEFTFCGGGSTFAGDAQLWLLDDQCDTVATYTDCVGNSGEIFYTPSSSGYYYVWVNQTQDLPMSGFRMAYRSLGPVSSPTPSNETPTAAPQTPTPVSPTPIPSNIRRVPYPYTTIQEAIDAAATGDTVLIANGTYRGLGNKDLTYRGKSIVVQSENGYTNCVIDCESSGRGFIFNTSEGNASVLQGITIANGLVAGSGGGIYCDRTSPRIHQCLIINCQTTAASNYNGGGIYATGLSAQPVITNSTIQSCIAYYGGGVYCTTSSSPVLSHVVIRNCYASNGGGGMYVNSGSLTISNSDINRNTSSSGGGGTLATSSSLTVWNCLIRNNSGTHSVEGASAFKVYTSSHLTVSNCTMVGNSGTGSTKIIGVTSGDATVTNSICYFNSPGTAFSGAITVTYSDIAGGFTGTGNIDANPRFTAGYYLSSTASGQQINSPAINAGNGLASAACFTLPEGVKCMSEYGTRTDGVRDSGQLDMGYHYANPGASAVTRLVPSQYATIQDAINAANDGDTVLVADGTYSGTGNYNLYYYCKGIIVRSVNGPNACVIDCQSLGRGVNFTYQEQEGSVLEGFTIINGSSASEGAGVYCYLSSPVIRNCIITNCVSSGGSSTYGGGISLTNSSRALIYDCVMSNCQATYGAGISCRSSSLPTVWQITINDCIAGISGGGIYVSDATFYLRNSELKGNTADTGGAGGFSASSVNIQNSLIRNNSASGSVNDDPGVFVVWTNSQLTISNCSIVGNYAASTTEVIYVFTGATATITNSIVYFNSPGTQFVGPMTITYSDIQGGYTGAGNINVNPRFTSGYYLSTITAGQSVTSPCIDAGSDQASAVCISLPYTNPCMNQYGTVTNGVLDTGVVDMGCHYLNPGITPAILSVPSQYLTIQDAIDAAVDGDTVEVADGTYSGAGNFNLYYYCKGIIVRSVNGPDACVIDCQSLGRGVNFTHQEQEGSVLDGFTIINGSSISEGGGVYCNLSNPVIRNCNFSNCVTSGSNTYGGGISCANGARPYIYNCVLSNCQSANGGGISCRSSSVPTVWQSNISDCSASSSGGGIYVSDATFYLRNSELSGNLAIAGGAGGFSASSANIANSLIRNNRSSGTASDDPSVFVVWTNSQLTISNCTIVGNSAASTTEVIYVFTGATAAITNSIVYFNSPGTQLVGTVTVTYSDIQGGFTGIGNINANPRFTSGFYLSAITAGQSVTSPCIDAGGDQASTVCFVLPYTNPCMDQYGTLTNGVPDTGIVDMGYHYVSPGITPEILSVPSQYLTIQDAIDAAIDGDTVEVADGTYSGVGNSNLYFYGKGITVRSVNGPETCVIDCLSSGRGVNFTYREQEGSVFDGFTIINASSAADGGGILCDISSPVVRYCIISNCVTTGVTYGGGIACNNGSYPYIENCIIRNCSAQYGAGIACRTSSLPTICGSTITNCSAANSGGALHVNSASVNITNSDLNGNRGTDGGAGYVTGSTVQARNCLIRNNYASSSTSGTGGFKLYSNSHLIIANGTLVGNSSASSYKVIYVDTGDATLVDSIVYFNAPGTKFYGNVTATYSDIQGGLTGTGNIDANPRFTAGFYLSHTATGQAIDSPCINTGSVLANTVCLSLPYSSPCLSQYGTRIDGVLDSGQIDMGYHYVNPGVAQETILVPDHYPTIQDAINAASDGDIVVVNDGTYSGTGNSNLYFYGKGITVRSANGPNACVIDCLSSGRGVNFTNNEQEGSRLEGFTIQNGLIGADGAGILCNLSSPTIINCIIRSCATSGTNYYGGGISCVNGASPFILNNSINNCSGYSGGGIACRTTSAPVILNNVISNCSSGSSGGGMYVSSAYPTISNSEFAFNTGSYGGAGYIAGTQTQIWNCLIRGNRATSTSNGGGAFYLNGGSVTINNCTFTANTSAISPVVLYGLSVTATVSNSIMYGNSGSSMITGSSISVSYSDIQGGFSGTGNINLNPLFVSGLHGNYYLSQLTAGQASDSPCVNSGNQQATTLCLTLPDALACMYQLSTSTDEIADQGLVDMGYHYPGTVIPTPTPEPYQTETPTLTPTLTPTEPATQTPVVTATPTVTETPTLTQTPQPTSPPTDSPTLTPTLTETVTPTTSPTLTPTMTETAVPTDAPTLSPTIVPTDSPTLTPTLTETPTITPSETPAVTSTQTLTPTIPPIPTTSPVGFLGLLLLLSLLIVSYRSRIN